MVMATPDITKTIQSPSAIHHMVDPFCVEVCPYGKAKSVRLLILLRLGATLLHHPDLTIFSNDSKLNTSIMRLPNRLKNLSDTGGFTLVEITLVLAITSSMIAIAFTGQHALEERASFDAAINSTLQDLSYARTDALANVNLVGSQTGPGDTLHSYSGGPVEVSGTAFSFDTTRTGGDLGALDTIYAIYNSGDDLTAYTDNPYGNSPACDDPGQATDCAGHEEYFSALPTSDYTLKKVGGGVLTGAEVLFINTDNGLKVCTAYTNTATYANDCSSSAGTIDLVLTNLDGYSSTIEINGSSGIAKRVN
jgi:Tfp pilus assembly protein FimT